ncbi:hypothetical protein QBC44DRAFT_328762 [Cladorrhinum sp. PSN332]|nr:hypothetical protein QBC44DRAFT_328762 [Cladorrhinum sp. PSN332]
MEPKRARLAFYRKVKTGCLTCKTRKVKCDEAKPHCQRCTSTGRKCDGYRSAAPETRKRPINILSPHPSGLFQSDAERRSFSYFQTRAGKALGGHFNQAFWGRQVMQAALHYPSIRHLVIALGSAYENFETGKPLQKLEFAFEQCNSSIKLLAASNDSSRSQSPETIASVLTASVLFIYLASIQGYIAEAVQHVRSAIKLLRDYDQQRLDSPRSLVKYPIPLSQLRALLLSIYGQLRIMIDSIDISEKHDMLVSDLEPATLFHSIDEAHAHTEQLLHNTHAFMQNTAHNPPITPKQLEAVVSRHKHLCHVLHSSRDALDMFESKSNSDAEEQKGIATLKLYHLIISIRLRINVFAPQDRESAFDAEDLDKTFREMLGYCEILAAREHEADQGPTCTSGLGHIMPLHMITARCRDPDVRGRALDLLLQSTRTEGIWNGRLSGLVAQETVAIEQEGIHGRVREVKIEFSGERGAVVRYETVKDWEEGRAGRAPRVRERSVEW